MQDGIGTLLALVAGISLLVVGVFRWSLRSGARAIERQAHWMTSVVPSLSLAEVESFLDAMIAEGRAGSSREAAQSAGSQADSVTRFQRRYGVFRIKRSGIGNERSEQQVSVLGLEPRTDEFEDSARSLVLRRRDGGNGLVVLMRDEDPPFVAFLDSASGVVTMMESIDCPAHTAEDALIFQLPTIAHFAASLVSVDDFERWTKRKSEGTP